MERRTIIVLKFVAICILVHFTTTSKEIEVKVLTIPIEFSKDVELACTIKIKDDIGHLAWIRLPQGNIMATNNISTDESKFAVNIHYTKDTITYILRIFKFNVTDVNNVYRCDAGFHSYEKALQLNTNDFIAKPRKNQIDKSTELSGEDLKVHIIIFDVYPSPICNAEFERENLTDVLLVRNEEKSFFYRATIDIHLQTEKCKGRLNLTCKIGNEDVEIMSDIISCKDSSNLMVIMCGSFGGIWFVGAVIVTVLILISRKEKEKTPETPETPEQSSKKETQEESSEPNSRTAEHASVMLFWILYVAFWFITMPIFIWCLWRDERKERSKKQSTVPTQQDLRSGEDEPLQTDSSVDT